MNPVSLKKQTQEIIDNMPNEKLGVVLSFLRWIEEEDISADEWEKIEKGEKEIAQGHAVGWRKIARTV